MEKFNKQKYDTEYAKQNYDRCIFNVPKGQKEVIKAHYKTKGYDSLNAYVNDLIRRDMAGAEGEKNVSVSIGRDNNGVINC